MSDPYTYRLDVAREAEPPADGILSRTIHNDDRVKVVLFGFAADQELSEHTASMPAVLQFVKGEAELTLGTDTLPATTGTFVHMPAGLTHAIRAISPTVMVLLLLKGRQT